MTGHLAASEVNPASNGQSRLQQFANCVEQNRLDTKIHQLAEAYDMPAAGSIKGDVKRKHFTLSAERV